MKVLRDYARKHTIDDYFECFRGYFLGVGSTEELAQSMVDVASVVQHSDEIIEITEVTEAPTATGTAGSREIVINGKAQPISNIRKIVVGGTAHPIGTDVTYSAPHIPHIPHMERAWFRVRVFKMALALAPTIDDLGYIFHRCTVVCWVKTRLEFIQSSIQ